MSFVGPRERVGRQIFSLKGEVRFVKFLIGFCAAILMGVTVFIGLVFSDFVVVDRYVMGVAVGVDFGIILVVGFALWRLNGMQRRREILERRIKYFKERDSE